MKIKMNTERDSCIMVKLHTERTLLLYFKLMIVILTAGWSIMVWDDTRIKNFILTSVPFAEPDQEHIFRIENLNLEDDGVSCTKDWITIDGWIIRKQWPASRVATHIILKNVSTDQCYLLPTTVVMRTDVTDMIDDGNNYNLSGFQVKIPYNSKIDVDHYDYEIYALFDVNNIPRIVPSGVTIKTWGG